MSYEIIIIYCIAGAVGGILMGLVGFGIGPIVVPTLLITLHMMGFDNTYNMRIAIATSLAVIVCNSLFNTIIHRNAHRIHLNLYYKLLPGSIIGAVIGSYIVLVLPEHLMRHLFAIILFIIATLNLFHNTQKIGAQTPDSKMLLCYSCLIAIISNIIGVSDGVLMVPFLKKLNLNMREAIGTATSLILPVSMTGLIPLIYSQPSKAILPHYSVGFIYGPALLIIAFASINSSYIAIKIGGELPDRMLKNICCIVVMGLSVMMMLSN